MVDRISDCFKLNFIFLKVFGLWPGRNAIGYYKYYSFIFLLINLVLYNILLTLNLVYTPRKIELLIKEVIFYFTEVAVTAKVIMILLMRDKIVQVFDILDCEAFKGEDDVGRQIVEKHVAHYKSYWKMYAILSNFSYSSQVLLPIFVYLIFSNISLELPICKYYFLNNEIINEYFILWFIYQSVGIYGHMQYNVNVDSLIAGFILMAITQVKILDCELRNLKTDSKDQMINESQMRIKLHKCILHYEKLIHLCAEVQDIISVTMFVQFSMASLIICVVLCGLTLPASIETLMFMVCYLAAMVLQIFVPAWLGTQLSHESQKLVDAIYNSQWISRSEKYKNTVKVFMLRANNDLQFTGLSIFPLTLDTFVSIIKSAYSFFTLVRNIQDREIN